VSLAPQPAGTSFSIVTPAGRVTAVGTVFSVESTEGGGLIARVLEGKVAVHAGSSTDAGLVRAGERLRLGDAQPSALTTEDRERDLALLPPERRALLSSALESAGASEAARVATPDALLERALALRAQGDFRLAAETYRKIHEMSPKSAAGGTALVARGELLLSSLSDPRGALASFDTYLAQKGALSREAEFGRVRALRALGRTADERRAIAEFLSQYPDAPQSRVLRQRLAALGR
jgi:tetratricopeptide (TPR) repeat protein